MNIPTYDESTSSPIEINPTESPVASVILLHGLGADGNDFAPLIPELHLPADLPVRFIFPHAPMQPVSINNGFVMRAWFDVYTLNFGGQIDLEGIGRSVTYLESLIDNEIKRGIPSHKIILAGFSQGAVIALTTGLGYSKPLGGILSLSGFLPNAETVFSKASPVNKNIPIFLAHGTADMVVPFALGQFTYEVLKKHNYSVNLHSYNMPHSVCAQEIHDVANWLKNCLK